MDAQPWRGIDTKAMTALFALPDHEVVLGLLPDIADRHVDTAAARARLRAVRGFVPAAVDPRGDGAVYWVDIGDHRFRHWQYVFTLDHLAREGGIRAYFSSPIAILDDDELFADAVPVAGLIFHVSRCGSTLLTKALGRLDSHVMISQGAPLQQGFWAEATRRWTRPLPQDEVRMRRFRNLVRAMCRRRHEDERRAFVKFISWNTIYASFIRAALPAVPAIFLYRDPVEVIASVRRDTTAVLEARGTGLASVLTGRSAEEIAGMDDVTYLAHCYRRYFTVAGDEAGDGFALLNYRDLGPERFPEIVERAFGLRFTAAELARMQAQFAVHAKDDSGQRRFRADSAAKQAALNPGEKAVIREICDSAMARLDTHAANLFAPKRAA